MERPVRHLALLMLTLPLLAACTLNDRATLPIPPDGASTSTDAAHKVAPTPAPTVAPDAQTPPPPVDAASGPARCPAPCPAGQDCVAVFPTATAGICLRPCGSGCGPCGGGPGWKSCSQCQVQISGVSYCMDFCRWKGDTMPCADPVNQACVDAYSIPNGLLPPGYPGSGVCAPR